MTLPASRVVGTSFYLGIPSTTRSSAYDCVSLAADLGIRHFFTSLQMPEADIPGSLDEFQAIGKLAEQRHLAIMADVHPIVFQRIGGNLNDLRALRQLGIQSLRLDAGFSDEEIRQLLNTVDQFQMHVVLNGSPVTDASLERLQGLGVPLNGTVASHNYYPRAESGLARSFVAEQALRLHRYGCVVMGFVASQSNHRYMTSEGLPTLEGHRYVPPGIAAQELFSLGWCDQVYLGDQTDDPSELKALLAATEDPSLVIRIRLNPEAGAAERAVALDAVHVHLAQDFALVHRAAGWRQKSGASGILPQARSLARRRGAVTVDNARYLRFAGELQIARVDLPADSRVNVVGWVIDEDLPLLESLGPRVRFRFQSVG